MLDGRFYRENYLREDASMLGPHQLAWLQQALQQSTAPFKAIVSPVAWADDAKVAADGGPAYDTWRGYRNERSALLEFLKQKRIEGVVLLSGDRHRSDVRIMNVEGMYPLYEIDSGRLTSKGGHKPCGETLFTYTDMPSFGLLTFSPKAAAPQVRIEIINHQGEAVYQRDVPSSELAFPPPAEGRTP